MQSIVQLFRTAGLRRIQYSISFFAFRRVLLPTLSIICHGKFKDAPVKVCWDYRGVYCSHICRLGLRCFCRALLILDCQIKAPGPVSWQTYLSSTYAIKKSEGISPCWFMCNSWKIAIGEFIKKKPSCSCWQVCERSGAKPKAVKNFVRAHAVHDGRLLQQQRSCPVSVFVRQRLLCTSWILLEGRGDWGMGRQAGPKHPSSAFHTPVWNEQAGGESPSSKLPPAEALKRNYGADKQASDRVVMITPCKKSDYWLLHEKVI